MPGEYLERCNNLTRGAMPRAFSLRFNTVRQLAINSALIPPLLREEQENGEKLFRHPCRPAAAMAVLSFLQHVSSTVTWSANGCNCFALFTME